MKSLILYNSLIINLTVENSLNKLKEFRDKWILYFGQISDIFNFIQTAFIHLFEGFFDHAWIALSGINTVFLALSGIIRSITHNGHCEV